MRSLVFLAVLAAAVPLRAGTDFSAMRRLYDFTPVSATNPVLARVKKCEIEIPVSEFQVYARSVISSDAGAVRGPLTAADKRRLLDGLLDEHFLLWDGYQKKADRTPEMLNLLRSTEGMLLQETLEQQEVGDKAKTPEDQLRLSKKLRDDIFEQTRITVSNESYDGLKAALKRVTSDPATAGPATNAVDQPLARWKGGVVTVNDVLQAWIQQPADHRPDLTQPEALTGFLKTMLEDATLIQAARDRGLEKSPFVLKKLQENRNVLTRMYALDRLTDRAVAEMKRPETAAKVDAWYQANLTNRYTYLDDRGRSQVFTLEKNRETIENDYFESVNERIRADYIRSLRQGRPIEINERLLDQTTVAPAPAGPGELPASTIAWEADTREHIIQTGETNALFTFQFTNVSAGDVTLYEVRPSCECTTVHLPSLPWKLTPGEIGRFDANVDLQNKTNSFTRSIQIESSHGSKTLTLKLAFPDASAH